LLTNRLRQKQHPTENSAPPRVLTFKVIQAHTNRQEVLRGLYDDDESQDDDRTEW